MGVYLYRIESSFRKMVTGEEVRKMKFIHKLGREEPEFKATNIDDCYVTYDFAQASAVYRYTGRTNLWWDSAERCIELYGYMLRSGVNRFKLVPKDEFGRFRVDAYELVESAGSDDGRTTFGVGKYLKNFGKKTNGAYFFRLERIDRSVAYSSSFIPPQDTGYDYVVDVVEHHLEMLYKTAEVFDREGLKEAS